eukprot:GHVS01096461.1.p1 GENE.GHVS01096461.1~~GHVS01096461.1.p1  ORF type:complete len:430 (-),score=71.35 GHVS01096461.1:125-1375(-)
MATSRALVSVYSTEEEGKIVESIKMPNVFIAPIRPDLVRYIQINMAKNHRQPFGVALNAGYQTSAESWGTGRAVSRIPRVPGGGTHRAGQAAFGNMCRGGGMFAPNKTWRRWHRKINITEKRHAVVSAIAASALPALVMARGHRIDQVPELPLVVADDMQVVNRTKKAKQVLKVLGCEEELHKVLDSRALRAGKGKMRNRRYTMRRGPLIIYHEDSGVSRGFRNIPGVELCHVSRLNLLTLAPGGSLGRLIIWSASAFKFIQTLYGSINGSETSPMKKNYHLPRPLMLNADVDRLVNSDEIQAVARPLLRPTQRKRRVKNPLTNKQFMYRLNPAAAHLTRLKREAQTPGTREYLIVKHRQKKRAEARPQAEAAKKRKAFYKEIHNAFTEKAKENIEKLKPKKTEEEEEGKEEEEKK